MFQRLVSEHMFLSKKSKRVDREGLRKYFFEKNLEFLDLSLQPEKFQRKQNFAIRYFTQLCGTLWKFQREKPRPMEIPHDFFLINAGNSTSFLIDLRTFNMLFLQYHWEIPCPHIPLPSVCIFSEIVQCRPEFQDKSCT